MAKGRARNTTRGPDGLTYHFDHGEATLTTTNVVTGEFVTRIGTLRAVHHRVTDNGDGTLTIVVQNTEDFVIYSEDGTPIGRGAGLLWIELVVDHGGTPTDPSDDQFLEFHGVVKFVGHSEDYCTAIVQAIG